MRLKDQVFTLYLFKVYNSIIGLFRTFIYSIELINVGYLLFLIICQPLMNFCGRHEQTSGCCRPNVSNPHPSSLLHFAQTP